MITYNANTNAAPQHNWTAPIVWHLDPTWNADNAVHKWAEWCAQEELIIQMAAAQIGPINNWNAPYPGH
jgi:hypothetical protein